MNILITGANGFIGKHLCAHLLEQNTHYNITTVSRNKSTLAVNQLIVKDIYNDDWVHKLRNIDTVIHLIGRAHITDKNAEESAKSYYKTNVELTQKVALAAKDAGVRKFIFISSIKVNGERSLNEKFKETDTPMPEDDYGKSKLEAEHVLYEISKNSDMKITVIRPPLIYGEGVKANFQKLIKISLSQLPLPLGKINNQRSLLYVKNLTDFICTCMHSPNAENETFLVSDDDDISTPSLIKVIAKTAQKKPVLIPMPTNWLIYLLKIIGKKQLIDKLINSLQVDITKAKTILNWHPPYTLKQGIDKTVRGTE